jgi:hypothetical protein
MAMTAKRARKSPKTEMVWAFQREVVLMRGLSMVLEQR